MRLLDTDGGDTGWVTGQVAFDHLLEALALVDPVRRRRPGPHAGPTPAAADSVVAVVGNLTDPEVAAAPRPPTGPGRRPPAPHPGALPRHPVPHRPGRLAGGRGAGGQRGPPGRRSRRPGPMPARLRAGSRSGAGRDRGARPPGRPRVARTATGAPDDRPRGPHPGGRPRRRGRPRARHAGGHRLLRPPLRRRHRGRPPARRRRRRTRGRGRRAPTRGSGPAPTAAAMAAGFALQASVTLYPHTSLLGLPTPTTPRRGRLATWAGLAALRRGHRPGPGVPGLPAGDHLRPLGHAPRSRTGPRSACTTTAEAVLPALSLFTFTVDPGREHRRASSWPPPWPPPSSASPWPSGSPVRSRADAWVGGARPPGRSTALVRAGPGHGGGVRGPRRPGRAPPARGRATRPWSTSTAGEGPTEPDDGQPPRRHPLPPGAAVRCGRVPGGRPTSPPTGG